MPRTDFFFKVEVEYEESDEPEQLGAEICRQIQKLYGVRSAELTNFINKSGESSE